MQENFKTFAQGRRSIRKFQPDPVPQEMIHYFIDAATSAPSGCNSQCWHFIALTDKTEIERLADGIAEEARKFYHIDGVSDDQQQTFLNARAKAVSFFRNAPLVFLVFMDPMDYYDPRVTELFAQRGCTAEQRMAMMGYPNVLSIGAAVQNMLLAIHEQGYGACWMNDPVIGQAAVREQFSIPENRRLMSVIPVGKPAYRPREKKMKDKDEILEIR